MRVKNYMESVVYSMLRPVLRKVEMCKCKKCLLDVAAIALNNLPPKYIVSEKGLIYTEIEALKQQFEVDVITEIIKAAEIVRKNCKHQDQIRKSKI